MENLKKETPPKNKSGMIIAVAAVVIAGIIAAVFFLTRGEKGYSNIRIFELAGTVTAGDGENEYDAYEGMMLSDGYSLTTDKDSYSRLVLDESTYAKLGETSRAVFTHTGSANTKNNSITLEYGTLTTELTESLLENESHIVNTPNTVIAVRGTFFRVAATDTSEAVSTDIYTYGGVVECRRILPDGTQDSDAVTVNAGFKIHVDENGISDLEPIDPAEIPDDDLVALYDASLQGHELFLDSDELWEEILRRGINIEDYTSAYDGGPISPGSENQPGAGENDTEAEKEYIDLRNGAASVVGTEGWANTRTGRFYNQFADGKIYIKMGIGSAETVYSTLTIAKNGTDVYVDNGDERPEGLPEDMDYCHITLIKAAEDVTYSLCPEGRSGFKIPGVSYPQDTIWNSDTIGFYVTQGLYAEGTYEFNGITYECEEWADDHMTQIMCFDGEALKYIITLKNTESGMSESVTTIYEYSAEPDETLFEIPEGYQIN